MQRKGFTLVELLVVIGILGILMATLVASIGGGTDAARAAQCKANLKNLATACSSVVANDTTYHYYPLAGSLEYVTTQQTSGTAQYKKIYHERKGWISWNSDNAYKSSPQSHRASASWFTSTYDTTDESRKYALTNGTLWAMMNQSETSYRCPAHIQTCGTDANPNWSYVMNAWFGWDTTCGSGTRSFMGRDGTSSSLHGDRRLLFAELQWSDYTGDSPSYNSSSGFTYDCTLQYDGCGGSASAESIGFNHKSGNEVLAHIVYADGHVGEIVWSDSQDMKELTKWLCTATEIAYDSGAGKYDEMDE